MSERFCGHPILRVPLPRPVDIFPTTREIAERALELFASDGRRLERFVECWRRAEDELLEVAARRASRGM